MSKPLNKQDATNVLINYPGLGIMFAVFSGVPTASVAGYGKGCLASDTTNGKLYINTGTVSSATWTVVGSQS